MSRRSTAVLTASILALGLGAGAATADDQDREAPMDTPLLNGVWVVTVDPRPTPAGDQPAFESTLAYGDAHEVNEITSRMTGTSAGLGRWSRIDEDTYAAHWHKYRFDSTGQYIGKTVIREVIVMTSRRTYTATSETTVLDAAGAVVARFESDAEGVRFPR